MKSQTKGSLKKEKSNLNAEIRGFADQYLKEKDIKPKSKEKLDFINALEQVAVFLKENITEKIKEQRKIRFRKAFDLILGALKTSDAFNAEECQMSIDGMLGSFGKEQEITKAVKKPNRKSEATHNPDVVRLGTPREVSVDLNTFLQKLQKQLTHFFANPIYFKDDCFQSDKTIYIDLIHGLLAEYPQDNLHDMIADVVSMSLSSVGRQQYSFAFDSKEIEVLKYKIVDYVQAQNISPVSKMFISRCQRGLLNLPYLINSIYGCTQQLPELTMALAHLHLYPLVRGKLSDRTNYISQPFSNLIENVFNCNILGYEHQSKIGPFKTYMDASIAMLDAVERNVQNQSVISLFQFVIKCQLKLIELIERTRFNGTSNDSFEKWIDDHLSINQQELSAIFAEFDHYMQALIKEAGVDVEAVFESCYIAPESDKDLGCIQSSAKNFMVSIPGLNYLSSFYEQKQNLKTSNVASSVASSSSSNVYPSCVSSGCSSQEIQIFSTGQLASQVTNTIELIENIVKRCKQRTSYSTFPSYLPSTIDSPIESAQLIVFLTLHGRQAISQVSLKEFNRELLSSVLFSSPFNRQSRFFEIVEVNSKARQQSGHQVSHLHKSICHENTDLPLCALPSFYTQLFLNPQVGLLDAKPGLGFFITFVDEKTGEKIGFMKQDRSDIKDNRVTVAFGGGLPSGALTISDSINKIEEKFKNIYTDAIAQTQIDDLINVFKRTLETSSLSATVDFKYTDHISPKFKTYNNPYCYMTIEMPIQVKNLDEARDRFSELLIPQGGSGFTPFEIHEYDTITGYFKDAQYFEDKKSGKISSDKKLLLSSANVRPLIFSAEGKNEVGKDGKRDSIVLKSEKSEINKTNHSTISVIK